MKTSFLSKKYISISLGLIIFILTIYLLLVVEWRRLTAEVTLGDTRPQPNATVKIINPRFKIPIMIKKTNQEGIATFLLPKGSYFISANYKSYSFQLIPSSDEKAVELEDDLQIKIPLRGGM